MLQAGTKTKKKFQANFLFRPANVQIADIVVFPVQQGSASVVYRKQ